MNPVARNSKSTTAVPMDKPDTDVETEVALVLSSFQNFLGICNHLQNIQQLIPCHSGYHLTILKNLSLVIH
ncbi:hypothetical protein CEXT_173921, partial [Caerostris extrusa]